MFTKMEKIGIVMGGISLGAIFGALGLSEFAVYTYVIMLTGDYVLGIIHAFYIDRGSIKSDTAIRGLIKKLTMFSLPFFLSIAIKGAGFGDSLGVVTIILGLFIVAELYSIIRHIYNINTGKTLPEIDVWAIAIGLLIDFIRNAMSRFTIKK